MESPRVEMQRLHERAVRPAYAQPGDAGLDLVSVEDLTLPPGGRGTVGTGWAMAIPDGWVGLVHPRSGLALRQGLTVANAPGTIDSGYRGEVRVILVNLSDDAVAVSAGDRVAQLLLQRVGTAELVEVEALSATPRGTGGFGSTGIGSAS